MQTPDAENVSNEAPIKPKGGEVYVLNWHGAKDRVRDYVADGYVWVADSTKSVSIKDYPGVEGLLISLASPMSVFIYHFQNTLKNIGIYSEYMHLLEIYGF